MTEPSRDTVLVWLAERPNRTAEDAVDRWWPDAVDRPRVLARVRQWMSRARRAAAGAPATDDPEAEGPPRPPADYETARLERIEFLEWHLAELIADLTWVRQSGMVGRIATLAAQVSEVRQDLDTARGANRVVQLVRSPVAVAEAVELRAKRIAELAAAGRAAKERDL